MPNCSRCGKSISVWSYDLATALCDECKAAEEQRVAEEQRAEQLKRALTPRPLPESEPVSGPALILISILIAALGGLFTLSAAARIVGIILMAVAGMVYLAGVIRWAVGGARLTQLDRLERQNTEIIDLLEIAAAKGAHAAELDALHEQRLTGKITDEQFRTQRKHLLRRSSAE
jgi:Flp pilus assembly protein TadB